MYHNFFTHSTIQRHLCCFCGLAFVNSALMNIGVHVTFLIIVSSGYMPNSRLLGHMDPRPPWHLALLTIWSSTQRHKPMGQHYLWILQDHTSSQVGTWPYLPVGWLWEALSPTSSHPRNQLHSPVAGNLYIRQQTGPGTNHTYQCTHRSWSHHNRRANTTHIKSTSRA